MTKQCEICGATVCNAHSRTRFCTTCRKADATERASIAYCKRKDAEAVKIAASRRKGNKLAGKTLGQVAAEARAHGMTYGKYVAAMEAGKNAKGKSKREKLKSETVCMTEQWARGAE